MDAERTQAPNATDRTPGMVSESTVSPFGKMERRSALVRRVSTRVITRGTALHRGRHARGLEDAEAARHGWPRRLRPRLPQATSGPRTTARRLHPRSPRQPHEAAD